MRSSLARTTNLDAQVRVNKALLVLGHLLISAEQVAGGFFQPANPTAQDEAERVASLTLFTPGGHIRVEDDAALFLFEYLVQNHGTKIGTLDHVTISKEAVSQLHHYFIVDRERLPNEQLFNTCKAIVGQLASRIA